MPATSTPQHPHDSDTTHINREPPVKVPIPEGWTDVISLDDKVKELLKMRTGLSVNAIVLEEVGGARYIFQSGSQVYIWNDISELGYRVTAPQGRDAVVGAIVDDWKGVTLEDLPYVGWDTGKDKEAV
ncbi:uncharacterized protein FIBRA_00817 [Fibroporia radiculosa]|uniref:Uncharacterized protein n=1 Tax=Fibroporia radiculosa TaxID=599839 RepID=J4HS87_9APHY|nr:uncharacterized protein FIBRA_00817 [Fibroporia radiculosa]CCL98812.1 predicted protein [Fibroporia radiculosa]